MHEILLKIAHSGQWLVLSFSFNYRDLMQYGFKPFEDN